MKNKKFEEAVELIKSRIYIELRTRFEIEEVEAIFKKIDDAIASVAER